MNSQESNEVHPAQAAIGEQFLTIEQVCRILACSRGSVYRMINDGDLRVFRSKQIVRVLASSLHGTACKSGHASVRNANTDSLPCGPQNEPTASGEVLEDTAPVGARENTVAAG